jgi:uncharacterized protein
MRQIFLLILLFVVGQWFVKTLRRAQPPSGSQGQNPHNPQSARDAQGAWRTSNGAGTANRPNGQGALPEPMVRCAECGVHAPRSESVTTGSQSFCSHEHARAYAARASNQDRAAR